MDHVERLGLPIAIVVVLHWHRLHLISRRGNLSGKITSANGYSSGSMLDLLGKRHCGSADGLPASFLAAEGGNGLVPYVYIIFRLWLRMSLVDLHGLLFPLIMLTRTTIGWV